MNWNKITKIEDIDSIIQLSKNHPILIFKHSTRCSISSSSLGRLERQWKGEHIEPYYLDLISYREISNHIADTFKVEHQSPQVLLIKDGECVFDASHKAISFAQLASFDQ